jgi:hypothetical protein
MDFSAFDSRGKAELINDFELDHIQRCSEETICWKINKSSFVRSRLLKVEKRPIM